MTVDVAALAAKYARPPACTGCGALSSQSNAYWECTCCRMENVTMRSDPAVIAACEELARSRAANKTLTEGLAAYTGGDWAKIVANLGPPPWIEGPPDATPGPIIIHVQPRPYGDDAGDVVIGIWDPRYENVCGYRDDRLGRVVHKEDILRHRRIPAAWLEAPK